MELIDLMIGDLVSIICFDGTDLVIRITGIKDGIVYGDSADGSHWANIEDVRPIQITPEILDFENERNIFGYKDYKLNQIYTLENRGETFSLVRKLNDFLSSTFWICDILYVHELQHALKLFKIKKEIVL